MNGGTHAGDFPDLAALWRTLEELEAGSLEPEGREELAALLRRSPAARRAYLEFFQQSAVLRMEAAKLHERGLLPVVGSGAQTRRTFQRSVLAAAALVALAAVLAAFIAVTRPEPARLAVRFAAETRWSIDGLSQQSGGEAVEVVEGSSVRVLSGTLRLELESGSLVVIQGPAEVAFPKQHRPRLIEGWLWVDAAESDETFQIGAGGFRIRDIGTRFGVRVPQDGPVEVHLVNGRVEVLSATDGRRLGEMGEGGKAFAFEPGGGREEIPLATDPFPALPALLEGPAGYRTTVLGQAPAGYWRLDEAPDGILPNEIAGSSQGRAGQATRAGEPGPGPDGGFAGFSDGQAAVFLDGSPQQSVLIDLDGRQGVHRREGGVSFWVRRMPDAPAREETLWLAGLGTEEWRLPTRAILHTRLTESGRVVFEIENGDADVFLSSSRGIADGRWHHVVASWGPSSVDLYIDGRLNARDSDARILEEARLEGRFVRFGKPSIDLLDRSDTYTGWVDEIALWNRPLTATEVFQQYQSARGGTGK